MASDKTISRKKRSMAFRVVRLAVLSVIFGLIVTVLSSLLIWVHKPTDLDRMQFGKPFPFLIQSYYGTVRDEYFPRPVHPQMTDDSCTTEFLPSQFALSCTVNVAVVAVVFFGFFSLRLYLGKKKPKDKVNNPVSAKPKEPKNKNSAEASNGDPEKNSNNTASGESADKNDNINPS